MLGYTYNIIQISNLHDKLLTANIWNIGMYGYTDIVGECQLGHSSGPCFGLGSPLYKIGICSNRTVTLMQSGKQLIIL